MSGVGTLAVALASNHWVGDLRRDEQAFVGTLAVALASNHVTLHPLMTDQLIYLIVRREIRFQVTNTWRLR